MSRLFSRSVGAVLTIVAWPALALAQSLAYVGVVDQDACVPPGPTGCTRGTVQLLDAGQRTATTVATLWQGVLGHSFLGLAASPDGLSLYVLEGTSASSASLKVVDPATGGSRLFGTQPAGRILARSADGSRLLVLGASLAVLDAPSEQLLTTIPAPGSAPSLEVSSDNRRAYASRGSAIDVFDLIGAGSVTSITVPAFHIRLSADGARLFAHDGSGNIRVIDTSSQQTVATIPPARGDFCEPRALALARGRLYNFTGQCTDVGGGGATIYDAQTLALLGSVTVPSPFRATPTADESKVIVELFFGQELYTLDVPSNTLVSSGIPFHFFGSGPVAPAPRAPYADTRIDSPTNGAGPLAQPFPLSGWAVDAWGFKGPGVDALHVWAFPEAGGSPIFVGADYGGPRPDLEAALGSQYRNSGFNVTVRGLAPGRYLFAAYAHSARTGTFAAPRVVTASVGVTPLMAIDSPADGADVATPVTISGWALELAASAGTGIGALHAWAYPLGGTNPIFVGAATLGLSRPDVAAAFGPQFLGSGFSVTTPSLPPGHYFIVLAAYDTLTGDFSLQRLTRLTVH